MFTRVLLLMSFVLTLVLGASVGNAGSLVGYWSFDEGQGTVVHDQSGNGNDGTINGAPLWIEGPFRNVRAMVFRKVPLVFDSRSLFQVVVFSEFQSTDGIFTRGITLRKPPDYQPKFQRICLL